MCSWRWLSARSCSLSSRRSSASSPACSSKRDAPPAGMTKSECCRGVCAKRLRDGLGARRSERGYDAFTLIELIVVVGVIIILTGLVLSTVGYARKKGARARAESEIAAMSAACESYKADNGVYPTNSDTDTLNPISDVNPSTTPP